MKGNFVKSMFKTSLLYILGTVMAKLVSFLLLPLYTKKIPVDLYGWYDLVVVYASIIIPLVGVNCWQGMLRFIIEEEELQKRHRIVSQGWFMMLVGMVVLSIGYFVFCLFVDFSHKWLIYVYFMSQIIQYFYLYTARGFNKNKVYAFSGIVSSVAVALSSIICIYVFDLKIETLYISMIASLLAQVVFIELNIHILRDLNIKLFNRLKIIEIYRFCFPEAVSNIFNWLLGSVNRVIIVAYLGSAANGIYGISNKFMAILSVFMTAFVLAFQESIYQAEKENISKIGSFVLKAFARYGGFAVSVILLGTSIIYPYFVMGEYTEGYNLIPAFYAYFFISGFTWVLSSVVSATKKTELSLYEKMIIGTVNFALVALLIRPMGLLSSPFALFVAELIGIFVFRYLLSKKANCSISLPVLDISLDLGLIALSSLVFLINKFWLNIFGMLILTGAFLIINRTEIKNIKALVISKIRAK